ncbi:MAG: UDP-4-amino-4,6-dideoxy-N-acetyl-beta-L-altrosamine transaminase [Rhodospirillaceae bacterium]|nr:UDP-4-amino-4,6-dideoxy-N-acetyl-beta-L-altrosamine transaminase [Rhodospirillaceae bacterium]
MSTPSFLPYGRHQIDEDDIAAVAAVLRSNSLTGGPLVSQFETAFAHRLTAPYAVSCANGTAALHLAAMALGLGPGDIAIVPSLTFLATASAPFYVGADVVFADVDPDTGLMTTKSLEDAIVRAQGRAKAVFPVHLNGGCVDLTAISNIATKHGLAIVDDACHAVGASMNGQAIGNGENTDMSVFSLHPVKTIAMGEGGVITTASPILAERLARFRNHGMVRDPALFTQTDEAFDANGQPNPWYYEMLEPGFNYRASEIHCALGLSQLGKLDAFLARRRELAGLYDQALAHLGPLLRPIPRVQGCNGGWHLYPVLIDFAAANLSRADLMAALHNANIGTQVHYLPVHRQPFWRSRQPDLHLPGADAYYARCLSLPLFPAMTDADINHVATILTSLIGQRPQ